MNSRAELHLDWCSHAAAKYACEKYHYSRSMPPPPLVRIGVWERGRFIGVVLFARGASTNLLKPYGLKITEGGELVRVALSTHQAPVSRIVAIAIRMLRRSQPKLRLLLSFADPAQGHHGGIYQALGWLYVGDTNPSSSYRDRRGRVWHERMTSRTGWGKVFGKYRAVTKRADCDRIELPGKHRYLLPLDDAMRAKVLPLALPYPKRAPEASRDAPADQAGEGGSTPTPALSKPRRRK